MHADTARASSFVSGPPLQPNRKTQIRNLFEQHAQQLEATIARLQVPCAVIILNQKPHTIHFPQREISDLSAVATQVRGLPLITLPVLSVKSLCRLRYPR